MPEICRFLGIIIRMFYDEHEPPHLHVEYQGDKAVFDFFGNIVQGSINSRTVVRLVREWIDLRHNELEEDWRLARTGKQIKKIAPLD